GLALPIYARLRLPLKAGQLPLWNRGLQHSCPLTSKRVDCRAMRLQSGTSSCDFLPRGEPATKQKICCTNYGSGLGQDQPSLWRIRWPTSSVLLKTSYATCAVRG